MGEYEQWLAGDVEWENLSPEVQERIDNEAMGTVFGDAMHSELLHKSVEEKRFTLGPWYIPNRLDAHSEWTDADELQAGLWDYVRKGDRGIRLQHNRDIVAGEWVEAMQMPVQVTMQKQADGDAVTYPEGTVFLGVVWKPWAWDLVKKGKIRGFSIGGSSARIPIEPVSKAVEPPLTIVPAVIRHNDRTFAVRPIDNEVLFSNGRDRHQTSLDRLVDAMHKDAETPFGWSADDKAKIKELVTHGPITQGFWFRSIGGWELAKAKSFGSRSDAGRYAANVRWQRAGIARRKALGARLDDMARAVVFDADGRPSIGPLGVAKTPAGQAISHTMGSLKGHVDFDAVADEMTKNPEKYGVTDPNNLPKPPYELVRKHMTDERKALHDDILDSAFAGKTAVEGRAPEYVFLGGGGASGKSSILESGATQVSTREVNDKGQAVLSEKRDSIEINADDIKALLPEYRSLTSLGETKLLVDGKGNPIVDNQGVQRTYNAGLSPNENARFDAASIAHEESSYLSKAMNARALKMGIDVVLDGTADGNPGDQGARLDAIANSGKGYTTRMVMVSIDTDTAVERSFQRAGASGRLVPEANLRKAHAGASQAFLDTKDRYDAVEGYYTGTRPATKFMEGTKGDIKVVNQKAYDEFTSKATESIEVKYKGGYDEWLALEAEA